MTLISQVVYKPNAKLNFVATLDLEDKLQFSDNILIIELKGQDETKCVTSILDSMCNVQVCGTNPNNDNKYTEYAKDTEAIVYLRFSES